MIDTLRTAAPEHIGPGTEVTLSDPSTGTETVQRQHRSARRALALGLHGPQSIAAKGSHAVCSRSSRSATLALCLLPAAARAAGPEHWGPFTSAYSFIGPSCDGFDIRIEGTETRSATVFFDDDRVDHVIERVVAPHDVLTNTVTGESIVLRGEFTHFYDRNPGTDTFRVAITGFRSFVNRRGEGVVLRDVGRIVYDTQFQENVLFAAGVHDLAHDADIEPALCAALA